MTNTGNTLPKRSFLMPWDHTGEAPFNQKADDFIKSNEGNIAYIEEAAASFYGMKWYSIFVWLKAEKDSQ